MICSSSTADVSSSTTTVRKGNIARVRCFARGQIFEACQRMEVSSESNLYTNGNGLIKLADGSGWAIVPHHDDLMAQFRSVNDRPDIDLTENTNGIAAYEEIGNALIVSDYTIPPPPLTQANREDIESGRLLKDIVWLRVVAPPNGTRILLPPSRQQSSIANGQPMKTESHAILPKKVGHDKLKPSTSCESETASMVVSGSFLDSVWNRITPTKESKRDHTICHHPIIPVIPCGMVVPVEPWDRSTNPTVSLFPFLFHVLAPFILTLVCIVISHPDFARSAFLACSMAKAGSPGDWARKYFHMRCILQTLESDRFGFEFHRVLEWMFGTDRQSALQ